MKFYQAFLLFLFLFFKGTGHAQVSRTFYLKKISDNGQTDFYHLKNFENTEQKSIPFIAQDSTGQMWFATKDGLVRYDTKKYHYYKHNSKDSSSIGGNFIERILVGKDGSVWVGTEPASLCKYLPKTDNFEIIKGIEGGRVKDIKQDAKGNYWITTNTHLYRYNDQSKTLNKFNYTSEKTELDRLLITRNQRIWITTNENFILEFIPKTKHFKQLKILDKKDVVWGHHTQAYSAYYLTEDYLGSIWIATPLGYLLKYNPEKEQLNRYVFEDLKNPKILDHERLTIMFILEDDAGNLWMGSWFNGLYRINKERNSVTHYLPNSKNTHTLSNNIIHSGFQDQAGYLWFGTEFTGINILKKNKKFKILSQPKHPKYSNIITASVLDKNGRIWLAGEFSGLYFIDPDTPEKIQSGNHFIQINSTNKDYFNTWVHSLLIDDQYLWIGTNKGLYRYDINTHQYKIFNHHKDDYNSIISNGISVISKDQSGNIWIGTNRGISKYTPKTDKFYHFIHEENNPRSLSNNIITDIYCDDQNTIWIGTDNGLNKFHPKTGDFTIFRNTNQKNSISENKIKDIYGLDNKLYIATQSGLNVLDIQSQKIELITTQQGLPDNYIKSIVSDTKKNIWLSTPHHLVKYNPVNKQMVSFGKSDGLENKVHILNVGEQDLEFTSNFAYKDDQGYLHFGGLAGYCRFHPDSLPINTYQAPIKLNQVWVNGSVFPIDNTDKITLNNKENNLKFSVSLMSYIQAEKNQYAFQLKNYDTNWRYTSTRNTIEYFNIPPGNYTLLYKGANNDGIWSNIGQTSDFYIKPVFYKTNLFRFLLGGFLVLLILSFGLHKIYLKRKFEQQKKRLRYQTSNLTPKISRSIDQKIQQIFKEQEVYLEADLSLNKLAQIIHEKPHYVSQVINQIHNKRFHDFINTYRIEKAKELLRITALKIEIIAYDSGFNSLSTFNSAFKKETGTTPSKYRKEFKKQA